MASVEDGSDEAPEVPGETLRKIFPWLCYHEQCCKRFIHARFLVIHLEEEHRESFNRVRY